MRARRLSLRRPALPVFTACLASSRTTSTASPFSRNSAPSVTTASPGREPAFERDAVGGDERDAHVAPLRLAAVDDEHAGAIAVAFDERAPSARR